MDLPEIMYRIMKAHALTQEKVCRILHYSSRTQLQRIMKKEVSSRLMANFGERLLAHSGELALTADEISAIQHCLLMPPVNFSDVHFAESLFDTISVSSMPAVPTPLRIQSTDGKTTHNFLAYLADASAVHIEIIGCDLMLLRDTLESLAKQCNLFVKHYYLENQSPLYTIRLLNTFWNFFHKSWFFPYQVKALPFNFFSGTSLLSVDIDFKDGRKESCFLFPKASDVLIATPVSPQHVGISALLLPENAEITPMKISDAATQDYLHYLNYIKNLEYNHRLFRIKADLGLELIPADIQLAAAREGAMHGYPQSLLDSLYEIENARCCNSRSKYAHQHFLLSYDAMLNFVQTGVLTDHFWGFRPFTPQERLAILQDFFQRATTSKYFHFSFLKPDVHLVYDELIWYEGAGICFLPPKTHYNIDDDHSEFILRDPVFCDFFSTFFRKWLFAHHALSASESKLRFLQLIDLCKQL